MPEPENQKPTLLLVDDEEENLLVLSTLLEMDYHVLTALDVAGALQILDQEHVDVLITDQRMPGTSGVELLRRARQLHPDVVRMALTAYTDVDLMLNAINEGAVYRYIIKPWSVEEMRLIIKQAVEWGRLHREHGALAAELHEANKALRLRNEELHRRNEELLQAREHMLSREKLAAVGRFAAEMAHEMNHHLQISELLLVELGGAVEGETPKQRVEVCRESIWQLAGITRDIQEYASGSVPTMRTGEVSPVKLIEQVITMCRRHPTLRYVEILLEAQEIGPCLWDGGKVMHLIANLLRNAINASPRGTPITVRLSAENEEEILLEVEDQGPGIPDSKKDWIFEPFHSTKGADGNGLGLTICRWVSEMHGGRIVVLDGERGGARFRVTLPRRPLPSARGSGGRSASSIDQ